MTADSTAFSRESPQRYGRKISQSVTLKTRIVRVVDGYWRVSSTEDEISKQEIAELESFLREIRFPYHVDQDGIAVPDSITWKEIEEQLLHFYDGVADVTPF